jgi:hypothetical protein
LRGYGSGFRVHISGFGWFRVLGFGVKTRELRVGTEVFHSPMDNPFRVSGFGFRVSGLEFRVSVFGFAVLCLQFRFSGRHRGILHPRVSGFGFRISGFRFRVSGCGTTNREIGVCTEVSHAPADNPEARTHDRRLPEIEHRLEQPVPANKGG